MKFSLDDIKVWNENSDGNAVLELYDGRIIKLEMPFETFLTNVRKECHKAEMEAYKNTPGIEVKEITFVGKKVKE